MKYLIQVTRTNRAERPSEQTIILDSIRMISGQFNDVSQNAANDNFFIFSSATSNVQLELMRILATMPFTPFALTAGDGFRVLPYPNEPNLASPREGSTFQLQITTEIGPSFVEYATYNEAITAISELDESDGYTLIDDGEDSKILSCRPSLWPDLIEQISIVQSKNIKGRTDKDRI